MNQFYKRPVLLIEFDEGTPFKLTDISRDTTFGADVSQVSIISKISLLTINYPNLQIIWSKGPVHTAEIFRDFKQNALDAQKDPDLVKIDKIGKMADPDQVDEPREDGEQDSNFNRYLPREFLKRIPGVSSYNVNKIALNVRNMVELVKTSEEDLAEIVGARDAASIKKFLEQKVPPNPHPE